MHNEFIKIIIIIKVKTFDQTRKCIFVSSYETSMLFINFAYQCEGSLTKLCQTFKKVSISVYNYVLMIFRINSEL